MKEVVISIRSIHDYGSDGEDGLEFTTDGLYSFEDQVGCISYYESEVTGLMGTKTKLCIKPDEVIVDRRGSVTSTMVFKKGEKNSFLYNTPYGAATMGIDTRKIRHDFDEHGGSMEIDYVVDMSHVTATRNRFMIDVRELRHG